MGKRIVMTHPDSERPGFAIPWEGRVLAGNTDIDCTGDMNVEAAISSNEDGLLTTFRPIALDARKAVPESLGSLPGLGRTSLFLPL